jgi:carbonic anhydrase
MGIGSIEYALSHLGTRHVLVLGHTNCGAVKAACGTLAGGDAGSESLNALVQDIHPRMQEFKGKKEFSKNYVDESWATARGAALELANKSQIVHNMLKENKIMISTAVYDLETGKVEFNK